MGAVEIVVPRRGARRWQREIVERLRARGHTVFVTHGPAVEWPLAARAILGFEARVLRKGSVLAEVVDHVPDQHMWLHAIAQVVASTDAAVGALAESAVETVADCLADQRESDNRALVHAVLSGLLDQAVKRAAAIA